MVAAQLARAGLEPQLWEPAAGSVDQRQDEWLGLWRQPAAPQGASRSMVQAVSPGR